jgi:hypothetical protein
LPKGWFKPVGQTFINVYNQRFNGQLGPEWAGRSMANILYHCIISFHNFGHPCFDKTAPAQLQVMSPTEQETSSSTKLFLKVLIAQRKLGLMGRPPVLADPNLGWGVQVRERLTAARIPRGYQSINMGDRVALHGVCMLLLNLT